MDTHRAAPRDAVALELLQEREVLRPRPERAALDPAGDLHHRWARSETCAQREFRVLSGPRGELWFTAHARAAPEEVRDLTAVLLAHLEMTGYLVPALPELAGRQRRRSRAAER